jgi:hypothetical protein
VEKKVEKKVENRQLSQSQVVAGVVVPTSALHRYCLATKLAC